MEIKCPFSLQNKMPETAMSRNSSCILVEGKYELKKKLYSPYYERMFGQMEIHFVTKLMYVALSLENTLCTRVVLTFYQIRSREYGIRI